MPRAEFLAEIDRPAPPVNTFRFDSSMLTDVAITNGSGAVVEDSRAANLAGIGKVCVATQFSDAIPVDHIRLGVNAVAHAGWDEPIPAPPGPSAPWRNTGVPEPSQGYVPPEPGGGFKF